ncbi:MAG: hypothetical protein WAT39_10120 [Planctomycetota bacterium]
MNTIRRFAALLFLVSSPLLAQSMTVTPNGVVTGGTTLKIDYSNSSLAGQTVVVTFTGGDPPVVQSIEIHLDSNGNGSGNWTTPTDWSKVYINASGVAEQVVVIT